MMHVSTKQVKICAFEVKQIQFVMEFHHIQ